MGKRTRREKVKADTLTIVPTRGRPDLAGRLVKSIWANADGPMDIVLVVNRDELSLYVDRLKRLGWHGRGNDSLIIHEVSNFLGYAGKIDVAASIWAKKYRYMFIPNDDHEVMTAHFDTAFKTVIRDEPYGLAYGQDGMWKAGEVPTAPFMTTSFRLTLGWTCLPGLQHILIDNVWMDLAKALRVCHYLPEVEVLHRHVDNGLAVMDDTYRETQNNEPRNQQDRERWWEWLESDERTENEQALANLWKPPRQITRPAVA